MPLTTASASFGERRLDYSSEDTVPLVGLAGRLGRDEQLECQILN